MSATWQDRWEGVLATVPRRRRQIDRASRRVSAPLFVLLTFAGLEAITAPQRERIVATTFEQEAARQLGFPLVWQLNDPGTAPPSSLNGKSSLCLPVKLADAALALVNTYAALSVFPRGFAHRLLDKVYVAGRLFDGGREVGGSAYGRTIYVAAGDMRRLTSQAFVRQTVFHETATLVLEQTVHTRPEAQWAKWERQWRAGNPEGYLYWTDQHLSLNGEEAAAALDMPGKADDALRKRGFLAPYGTASIRADFDTYADAVFTRPAKLKAWMAAYPGVRHKVAVFEQTYRDADPRFAAVFERLGIGNVAP